MVLYTTVGVAARCPGVGRDAEGVAFTRQRFFIMGRAPGRMFLLWFRLAAQCREILLGTGKPRSIPLFFLQHLVRPLLHAVRNTCVKTDCRVVQHSQHPGSGDFKQLLAQAQFATYVGPYTAGQEIWPPCESEPLRLFPSWITCT